MKPSILIRSLALVCTAAHLTVAAEPAASPAQEGWRLWGSGKPAEAIVKFQEAVKLDPRDANAWNGLGWASFNTGRTAEAEQAFEKVLALQPNHAAALNGRGQILLSQREYKKAEPFLKKAADGKASAAWYGLARMYLLQGRYSDAERYAQMLEDSAQADATAKKMLEAAKARNLPAGLRATIEPPAKAN
jgi:Flp pilus assembly protein TadD